MQECIVREFLHMQKAEIAMINNSLMKFMLERSEFEWIRND